jgi:hypothetical protein
MMARALTFCGFPRKGKKRNPPFPFCPRERRLTSIFHTPLKPPTQCEVRGGSRRAGLPSCKRPVRSLARPTCEMRHLTQLHPIAPLVFAAKYRIDLAPVYFRDYPIHSMNAWISRISWAVVKPSQTKVPSRSVPSISAFLFCLCCNASNWMALMRTQPCQM